MCQGLSYSNVYTVSPGSRDDSVSGHCYAHLTDEATEAQRGVKPDLLSMVGLGVLTPHSDPPPIPT